MFLGDRPYVPPACPRVYKGENIDVTALPFRFCIGDTPMQDDHGNPTDKEVWASFEDPKNTQVVDTDSVFVDSLKPDGKKVLEIEKDAVRSDKVRSELLKRVANCHGVTDGECWALGSLGIRTVIDEV